MATVTSLTADRMIEIEDASIVDAHLDGSGHLILTKFDTTEIDTGALVVPDATETVKGIVELATTAEAAAAVDTVRAVTPAGLAAMLAAAGINSLADVTIAGSASGDFLRWNGTAWVNENDLNLTETQQLFIGGSGAGASIAVKRTNATDDVLSTRVGSDTNDRLRIEADGSQYFGDGSAGPDAKFYRSAAGILKTDTALTVGTDLVVSDDVAIVGNLDVTGVTALTGDLSALEDAVVFGNFKPSNSGVFKTKGNAALITVASTTSESVVASYTIVGNSVAIRSQFRIALRLLTTVTGTPTLTIRARIGGVAGNVLCSNAMIITAASGVSDRPIFADLFYIITGSGGSGTGRGFMTIDELLSVSTALPATPVSKLYASQAPITHDTTVDKDLVITVQWSVSSASNVAIAYVQAAEQVS